MVRRARDLAHPDLLSWPKLRDAESRAIAAEDAWRDAQRRFRLAPHGERQNRHNALKEASAAALRAARDLALLQDRLKR